MFQLYLFLFCKLSVLFWAFLAFPAAQPLKSTLLCWVTNLLVLPCHTIYMVATTGACKSYTNSHAERSHPLHICMPMYMFLLYFSNQNFKGASSPQIRLPTRVWSLGTWNNRAVALPFYLYHKLVWSLLILKWLWDWAEAGRGGWRPWPSA